MVLTFAQLPHQNRSDDMSSSAPGLALHGPGDQCYSDSHYLVTMRAPIEIRLASPAQVMTGCNSAAPAAHDNIPSHSTQLKVVSAGCAAGSKVCHELRRAMEREWTTHATRHPWLIKHDTLHRPHGKGDGEFGRSMPSLPRTQIICPHHGEGDPCRPNPNPTRRT